MTAFVVNGGGTTNWDTLTGGSTNATLDTYAISNNTILLIDTDTYQCANHSTAFGSLDTVTFSGVGGKIKATAKNVRIIPYNTGAGNVPAVGTSITQGGVSGTLLGVWASWLVEPTATGAAMPASGFIKIKNKAGGDYAAGALTGIGASATGADYQGWIEIRGANTATITVPRIGSIEFGEEDWFEIGVTNGSRGQVIPFPTCATVDGTFPGWWIETSAGSGVYERYANAGNIVALASIPTDERGKILWHTTSGVRIGFDGTNNVGFLPPTGCRVRIPAVILTCCTRTVSGSGPRVLPNATLGTRQEFVTSSAGDIQFNGVACQWYANFGQAYRAKLYNSAISDTVVYQEVASPADVDNIIVSPTQAQVNIPWNSASCFAGGTVKNSFFARFSATASGNFAGVSNYNKGIRFENVKSQILLNRASTNAGPWTATQSVDCEWVDCWNIGGTMTLIGGSGCTITNLHYADNFSGTTGTGTAIYAINLTTGCAGFTLNGFDMGGLTNVQPYSGIFQPSASYNWTVRNIGDETAPLNLGSTNAAGLLINSGGNNDGGRIQRCYVSNTRTGLYVFLNSDNNIVMETPAGDYADASVMAALNTIMKGVRMTGATTGQASVYGTHWGDFFTSATVGKVSIFCNEPTVSSAAQCAITAGTPKFNSGGQVALTNIGDQVTWEMPYFAIGHTSLANLAPTLTGTNTGNLTYEFQYDFGSGYNGTWLTLNAANLSGAGAINPVTGFRLKVRATCATANAGNLLTHIAIPTVTDATSQNEQYPLDPVAATYSFSGLVSGTEVILFNSSNVELKREVIAGTVFEYDYLWTGTDITGCYALIWKDNKVAIKFTGITLTSATIDVPISQSEDLVYNGTYTPASSLDFTNSLQILGGGASFSIPQMYSEWKDAIRLGSNAQYSFAYIPLGGQTVGAPKQIPKYVFQQNGWKFRPAEASGLIAMTDGIVVPESGSPFVSTVGAFNVNVEYDAPVQAIAVSTGGTVAPTQQQIRDAMTLAPVASPVAGSVDDELKKIKSNTNLIPAGL